MKRSITNERELEEAISILEKKADDQRQVLKEHFSGVMENMKPLNLIRHGLQSAFSGNNKLDLMKTVIGIGSGLLGRRLLARRVGGNVLRKIIGAALEFGVVGIVAKNAERIKEKGSVLIDRILHKKKPSGSDLITDPEQPTP
jgi:hypothetical protein